MSKQYLVYQSTCEYNRALLEASGWESKTVKNNVYSIEEYYKSWHIQDMDGSPHEISVTLRQCENYCHTYVGNVWVGRSLTLTDAERIVKAIRKSCL